MRGLKFKTKKGKQEINASHPSRMRGLKCFVFRQSVHGAAVASLADAWIEMRLPNVSISTVLSHPSRMRGLKLTYYIWNFCDKWSHPSRMRGLKSLSLFDDGAGY